MIRRLATSLVALTFLPACRASPAADEGSQPASDALATAKLGDGSPDLPLQFSVARDDL